MTPRRTWTVLLALLALLTLGAFAIDRSSWPSLVGDEATVKTYAKSGERIVLKAENPDYEDIVPAPGGAECRILGRVFEVRRRL